MNLFILILMISCNPSCSHNPEPETYLIPEGFRGRVNVIFNQENGVPIKYENGRRVYEIPRNGILLTQFKDEYGIIDHQYFYVDRMGNRNPLPIFQYKRNDDGTTTPIVKDSTEIGIFLDGTTGLYGNSNDVKSVKWQEFIVSDYRNYNKLEPLDSFENRVKRAINYEF